MGQQAQGSDTQSSEKRVVLANGSWITISLVAGMLFLLACLFTWPLVTQISTHIPGYSQDINQYYWCQWWFGEAMSKGMNPWFTDMFWHPNGTPLVFSTNRFVSSAAGWLFSPVVGLTASYNLIILVSFVIAGLGMFLFVRRLTNNVFSGFAAALIFAFNPWIAHKLTCHHFLLSIYSFGYVLLLIYDLLNPQHKKRWKPYALALLLAVTLYDSLFCFDLLALALVLFVGILLVTNFKILMNKAVILSFFKAGGLFLLLAIPMILMIVSSMPLYGNMVYASGATKYSNDVYQLFWYSPMPWSPGGKNIERMFSPMNHKYRARDENFGPIGWLVWPLALFGWWVGRKNKPTSHIFLFCAVFFMLMSLGPVLHVAGKETDIPLLYSFLSWLPPVKLVRAPSRFIILAFLFLSPLVGFAIKQIASSWKKYSTLISVLIIGLIVFDYFPRGFKNTDLTKYPQPVNILAEQKDEGAVLSLGMGYDQFLPHQIIHGKPVIGGYVSRAVKYSRPLQGVPTANLNNLLELYRVYPKSSRIPAMAKNLLIYFKATGIKYVEMRGPIQKFNRLQKLLPGEPLGSEENYHCYKLDLSRVEIPESFTISADNWLHSNLFNLYKGKFAQNFWTGHRGFTTAIPKALNKRGRISVQLSSAITPLSDYSHEIFVYANRQLVHRTFFKEAGLKLSLELPDEILKFPVNTLTIRSRVLLESKTKAVPLVVVSSDVANSSLAGLEVNSKPLLSLESGDHAVFISVVDGKSGLPSRPEEFSTSQYQEGLITSYLEEIAPGNGYLVFTRGAISAIQEEELLDFLVKENVDTPPRQISGHSFIAYCQDRRSGPEIFSSVENIIAFARNVSDFDFAPVLTISSIKAE